MIIRIFTLQTLLFILLLPIMGQSQVKDLSYTLSPSAEYILWGDRAGLEDGFAVGGKLGFGFGQHVELSGTYLQALNLQTNFSDFGLPGFEESSFTARDVDWQRYGGELRLNLSRGVLLPFLTLGSGIQRTELIVPQSVNTLNEQIYIDLGAGVVLSLADRYTLSLAVRNNQYRFNAVRDLMTEPDRNALGIAVDEYGTEKIVNWGLNASLQFYIGGRDPGKMTAVDNAYRQAFGSGLQGISVPIEPVAGKINFHKNLSYRDTWYAGGQIGINFGSYIGLRGFYWRAMEDEDFRKFDDLSLYGGEAKFNLNSGQGVTPFITLGGGYLNVLDSYEPRPGMIATDQPFAMGGAGLTLPLSPYFKLFGGARAILLSQEDLDDLSQPNDVLTSWNYHFGVRLIVGQKAKNPNLLIQQDMENLQNQQQQEYQSAKNKLNEEYQNEISSLKQEVATIQSKNDSLLRVQSEGNITTQGEGLEKDDKSGDTLKLVDTNGQHDSVQLSKSIRLSPEELAELMKVFTEYSIEMKKIDLKAEAIRSRQRAISRSQRGRLPSERNRSTVRDSMMWNRYQDTLGNQSIQMRRSEFERFLRNSERDTSVSPYRGMEIATDSMIPNDAQSRNVKSGVPDEVNQLRLDYGNMVSGYEKEIDEYETQINTLKDEAEKRKDDFQQERIAKKTLEKTLFEIDPEKRFETSDSTFIGRMYYKGLSGIGGVTFGDLTAITLGVRTNFGIRKTNFSLMAETYAGLGSGSLLGFSVSGIYGFRIAKEGSLSRFVPYAGVGVGLQQVGDKDGLQGTYGTILGAELELWNGKAFVDYTMRNIFDYNQIVLGYKFPF